MRLARVLALSLLFAIPAAAQKATPAEDASVRAVLTKQAVDWNRGDLDAFATGYKNSPDILFIGKTIRRGYQGMIESYRKNYPNKAAMGVLTFSNLEVHPLDAHFATVLGNFHLERTAAGGGNADGYYSLVMEKTPAGWKIVLDHTTVPPSTQVTH
jgi:ketosteroid isomerase-like protein